jgi:hypothetical protein
MCAEMHSCVLNKQLESFCSAPFIQQDISAGELALTKRAIVDIRVPREVIVPVPSVGTACKTHLVKRGMVQSTKRGMSEKISHIQHSCETGAVAVFRQASVQVLGTHA